MEGELECLEAKPRVLSRKIANDACNIEMLEDFFPNCLPHVSAGLCFACVKKSRSNMSLSNLVT